MKTLTTCLCAFLILGSNIQAQIWKKKSEKADTTQAAEPEKEEKKKSGGGLFQKVIAKVSKGAAAVGGGMTGTTSSTSDFNAIEPMVYFMSNLVPREIGTMDMDFFGNWKTGGDFVGVMLFPKDKTFFYKLDGTVKFDGAKADYQTTGLYTQLYDGAKPIRVLEMETSDGKKAKFTLRAKNNAIKLVSVNGKSANAAIDVNKDFTIELKDYSTDPNALIKLQITGQTIGLRAWYDLGYFKPAASITIPGYIIRHVNAKGINFKNAYIQVGDAELAEAKDEAGGFKGTLNYYTGSNSTMAVSLLNEGKLFEGLSSKETSTLPLGKMTSEFNKPNASSSMPFSWATTVAASTFAVRGTTYYYDQKENKFLETKTTKEIEFPQIPDEKLDAILEQLYARMTTIIKEELGANVLPAETVSATKEFAEIAPFTASNQNTDEHFTRAYKGLRPMAVIVPLATTYKGEGSLFKAAGANALLKVVLNLQVSWDNKPVMQPILDVEMLGPKNGGDLGLLPTKYFTAKITGEGYRIKGKTAVTDEVLAQIVRLDDLMAAFRAGLKDLVAKEKASGEYERIWNLQR